MSPNWFSTQLWRVSDRVTIRGLYVLEARSMPRHALAYVLKSLRQHTSVYFTTTFSQFWIHHFLSCKLPKELRLKMSTPSPNFRQTSNVNALAQLHELGAPVMNGVRKVTSPDEELKIIVFSPFVLQGTTSTKYCGFSLFEASKGLLLVRVAPDFTLTFSTWT